MIRNSIEWNKIPIEENLPKLDFSHGLKFDENKHLVRNSGLVNDCYLCVRPGNKMNVPKINLKILKGKENKKETKVINNYGHGGIGWSLMWGSVLKAIEFSTLEKVKNYLHLSINSKKIYFSLYLVKIFLKNEKIKEIQNTPKIAILGSGAIGLATALLLIHKGIPSTNIKILTKNDKDSTSHRSGAILSTASVLEKIDPELEKIYYDINIDTFKIWEKIHNGEIFQKLQYTIKKIKAYFGAEKEYGCIETDSGLDIFVDNGLIPKPELIRLKFGNTENLMRKYDSYYFNTFRLMKCLNEYIREDFKIPIDIKEVNEFESLVEEGYEYIFNCTGVENLNKFNFDTDILPIGGHIVTVKNQKISDFDYVIYSHYIHKEDIGKYNIINAPLFYFMLKTDDKTFSGLLGGSLLNNYDGGDKEKDEYEYKQILKRTLEIFGEDPNKFLEMSENDIKEKKRADEMKNYYHSKDSQINLKPKF